MKNFIILLFTVMIFAYSCSAQDTIKTICPNDFAKEIVAVSDVVVLDVRTAKEYAESHLNGAINIDFLQTKDFEKRIAELDKTKTYYVYCRSGKRSHNAAVKMRALGFNVVDMKGGIIAWNKEKLPTTK